MDITRADRVQLALELRDALRRTPAPGPNDGATLGPVGNCGRDSTESCGMINPEECAVHCAPADNDPETLQFSGTAAMRREQLAERRRGSRF